MKREEEKLHRALVAYLRTALPKPWLVWHTPNGGGRSKAEAGVLKALGTLAGMPDLFVLGRRGTHSFVYLTNPCFLIAIELKAPKLTKTGRADPRVKLTPAQKDTIAALAACGVPTVVSNDLADAVAQLKALGVPLRGRVMC